MTLRLAFVDEHGRLRRVPVEAELVLGRGDEAAVRLAPRNVSRRHARIVVEAGVALVEDLGSRNGTSLNGQPVRGRRRLRGGDVLSLADEPVRVEDATGESTEDLAPADASPAPPRPPRERSTTLELRPRSRLGVAVAAALRRWSRR